MAKENWVKQEGGSPIWLPTEENEELVGVVAGIVEGSYGLQYSIKKDDGEELRTPSHKVLVNRMAKVKEGDRVRLIYLGEQPPAVRGQNPTRLYEVYKQG